MVVLNINQMEKLVNMMTIIVKIKAIEIENLGKENYLRVVNLPMDIQEKNSMNIH